jgi:transmembrane sensor
MIESDDPGQETPSTMSPFDDVVGSFDPVEREAYEWVARFMGGDMKTADIEAMKAWYGQSPAHAAAYAEVRRVWLSLGPAAIAVMRQRHIKTRAVVSRRSVLGGALAASAAGVGYLSVRPPLDLWPSYAELMADYRTQAGEQRQMTLSGTFSLDLNTKTSIAVQSQTADATRIELISGEIAISTGAASPPLTVVARAGRVVAAKADFNLRCDGNEVQVSCLQGDLKVERAGVAVPLTAGQQIGYGPQGMGVKAVINPDAVTAWQHGMLIFEGSPVAEVIEEVNRYRPGRIVLMNREIGQRLLNARLPIAEADKIVTQIVHIFGAKATALPGGIVILT